MIPGIDPYAAVLAATAPERETLARHPVYGSVPTPQALVLFLESHVFVEWNTANLVAGLKRTTPRVATRPGHLALYLDAMRDIGAELRAIPLAPEYTHDFIRESLATASSADEVRIASSLVFAADDNVTETFRRLVPLLEKVRAAASLRVYLDRHEVVSEGESRRILETICEHDVRRWRAARDAAKKTLRSRIELLDGIAAALDAAAPARRAQG